VPAGGHRPPYVGVDGPSCAKLNNALDTKLGNLRMIRNLIVLGIIGSILMLCQWFVFQSVREYAVYGSGPFSLPSLTSSVFRGYPNDWRKAQTERVGRFPLREFDSWHELGRRSRVTGKRPYPTCLGLFYQYVIVIITTIN
jgi:hypothetical protein